MKTLETEEDFVNDPNVTLSDIYMADVMRSGYEEDLSSPKAPPGFVKVLNHNVGLVRKASIVYAFFSTRELVSADRLKRFITKKKKATSRDTHMYTSDFVVMNIEQTEEHCQVVGFRKMNGRSQNIPALEWPLYDEKKKPITDVGALVNLFKYNREAHRLTFLRTLINPISLSEFVRHVEPEEYLGMIGDD